MPRQGCNHRPLTSQLDVAQILHGSIICPACFYVDEFGRLYNQSLPGARLAGVGIECLHGTRSVGIFNTKLDKGMVLRMEIA